MAIIEIEDKISEIINKHDHNNFIYDFLSVYNIPRATITKLRKGINNLSNEKGEVYLKNKLYYKQTDEKLMQAFTDIKEKVDKLGSKPRYILVTDFKDVLAYDTKINDTLSVTFEHLPQKFEFFLAWNGIEKADFDKENPADVRAAERFANLYDVITNDNPNATKKGLNLFFIRILFCLFAEDTDIFAKNLFTNRVKELTKVDGSDLDDFIRQLFGVLDVNTKDRTKDTPSWLQDFPYVDGDLFKEPHESLKFTNKSRKLIIDAGEKLEWDQINPDILGSMMQAVASEDSRSHLGMHYTSVPNIMKVIKPLFLDDLREDFEKSKGNFKKLNILYNRIGNIKFMDPACGSGNFLIVTYKQLRQLEIDILKEQNKIAEEESKKATMYIPSVTLDQFYGIEIDDFACDTTRLSLWIAEHQMNIKLREKIDNAVRPTLPLHHAGAIVRGNALRLDWDKILPHKKDDEVYLFGNPPYLGARKQSDQQKSDLNCALQNMKGANSLDYISGWFYKSAEYVKNARAKICFVTTNSISQGEQVPILWPKIFKLGITIFIAYKSFEWKNNARNNAKVIVSIIGLADSKMLTRHKVLYRKNYSSVVNNISPYLIAGSNKVVKKSNTRDDNLPIISFGSMPNDGGHFIITEKEFNGLDFKVKPFFKRYIGSSDFVNGKKRYCLWLYKINKQKYQNISYIQKILDQVKKYRLESDRKATKELANKKSLFGEIRWKNENAIIIPRVTSKNRLYIPIGYVGPNCIISDSALAVYGAPLWLWGIISSKMHMVWLRTFGGRLKMDYRYSAGLVYNTFPMPSFSKRRKNEIEKLVLKILDIREEEGGTLADLYGSPLAEKQPKPMNARLLKAHQELDEVVDRAYKSSGFRDDNERLSLLLDLYSKDVGEIENE